MTQGVGRGRTAESAKPSPAHDGSTPLSATVANTGAGRQNILRDEAGIVSVVRCLEDELIGDQGFQSSYLRESAALQDLAEPELAEPLNCVTDAAGRIIAVARRYVAGVKLSELLARHRRGLDVQTATVVVKDVLTALDALHRRGVPHRTVDPRSVVVGTGGHCVLTDVGLTLRPRNDDPATAMAWDLAAALELFTACIAATPAPPGAGSPADAAVEGLAGVSQRIYSDLAEVWQAVTERRQSVVGAAAMLAALEGVTSDCFDGGWAERSRDRLAADAGSARRPPARILELLPLAPSKHDNPAPRRLKHDSTPPRHRHLGRRRVDAARTRTTAAGTAFQGVDRRAVVRQALLRIVIPLAAFLLVFEATKLVFSDVGSTTQLAVRPPGATASSPHGYGSPPAAPTAAASPAPVSPTVPKASLDTTPVAAAVTATPSASSSSPAAPPTAVTSLAVSGVVCVSSRESQGIAIVGVQASGVATVDLAVTVTQEAGDRYSQQPQTQTQQYTVSGERQYDITDDFPATSEDQRDGQVAAEVEVTATVPGSGAAPVSTFENLGSGYC